MRNLMTEELEHVSGGWNNEPIFGNNGWGNGEHTPPGGSAGATVGDKFTATGDNPAQSDAAFNNGDYPLNR